MDFLYIYNILLVNIINTYFGGKYMRQKYFFSQNNHSNMDVYFSYEKFIFFNEKISNHIIRGNVLFIVREKIMNFFEKIMAHKFNILLFVHIQ